MKAIFTFLSIYSLLSTLVIDSSGAFRKNQNVAIKSYESPVRSTSNYRNQPNESDSLKLLATIEGPSENSYHSLVPMLNNPAIMVPDYYNGHFDESSLFSSYLLGNKSSYKEQNPEQVWDIYYGGNSSDFGWSSATDPEGNVYIAGYTFSPNDIASNGFQTTYSGSIDAFLVKFDPQGNRKWATYFGGHKIDKVFRVATDSQGNVYITGHTRSSSGITFGKGHQQQFGGEVDAFVAKFDQEGQLKWSSYLGGAGEDYAWNLACDLYGNVYVTGYTSSTTGISINGRVGRLQGKIDGFLAKFSSEGQLQWSTYTGGEDKDYGRAVAIGPDNSVYLTGVTYSKTGISSASQTTFSGACDVFVSAYSPGGTLKWSTYFGGQSIDDVRGIAVDRLGNLYFSGYTFSHDGIASESAYQKEYGGGSSDAFIAKFNSIGQNIWSTYFGGDQKDRSWDISCDRNGAIYIAGGTTSFQHFNLQQSHDLKVGKTDAFLVKFTPSGSKSWAVLYGSENEDYGRSVSIDLSGNVYLCGSINNNAAFLVKYREESCQEPRASFDFQMVENKKFTFKDLSTNVLSNAEYSWDINNDGTVDYQTKGNIQHTFTEIGKYKVKLIIRQGACQSVFEKEVDVNEINLD